MAGDIIIVLVVVVALGFDFTNGFHDTANAMATTIATGALKPRVAVTIAALLNFIGAFISLKVAATVAEGIVQGDAITPSVVFGGLVGAIAWNLGTWWFGLPSSSSHALIGGVVGSTLVAAGGSAVEVDGLISDVIVPALVSPVLAGAIAAVGVLAVYAMIRRFREDRAEREFRWAQVASSSMVALAHGTNDAQKTMGVISLALIANGSIQGGDAFEVPFWVVFACATAIALGTYSGGWRIMKTLGTKVVEVRPPQGFGSEAVAATVILASSHVGFPLSTTQVVSGAVTGSGVGRPGAKVNWGVAGRIVIGWMLTLPAAAATAAIAYAIIDLFGDGAAGPIVVGTALAAGCVLLFVANRRQSVAPEDTVSENPTFGGPRAWRCRRDRRGRDRLGGAHRGGVPLGRHRAGRAARGLGRRHGVVAQPGRQGVRRRRGGDGVRRADRRLPARAPDRGRARHLLHDGQVTDGSSPSGRPVRTVLDTLRARIDPGRFDAVALELETVAADLGYGDVRPLSGSVAWIERLREEGKRIALIDGGGRGDAALRLAGLDEHFDLVAPTLHDAVGALGVEPGRVLAVEASAEGVATASTSGSYLTIGVARGLAAPEQLRRAGADAVVADLHELL